GACHRARIRATRWLAMTANLGADFFQLLQAAALAHFRWHWRLWKARLPVGDADLADIDVASRVERQPVRRQEFSSLDAWAMLAAAPRNAFALGIHDGQARAEIGHFEIDGHAWAEFTDYEIGMLAAATMQRAGTVQIVPLRLVFAIAVEH